MSFKQKVEGWQGDNADYTALNAVSLVCYTGDEICSREASWGSWKTWDSECKKGFYGSNFKFERWQGDGDDTAANELRMVCRDPVPGRKLKVKNGASWGDWLGNKTCPDNEVICGIKTKVEQWQGDGDATALNGVELICCK